VGSLDRRGRAGDRSALAIGAEGTSDRASVETATWTCGRGPEAEANASPRPRAARSLVSRPLLEAADGCAAHLLRSCSRRNTRPDGEGAGPRDPHGRRGHRFGPNRHRGIPLQTRAARACRLDTHEGRRPPQALRRRRVDRSHRRFRSDEPRRRA
jgi:hypothetical protein